MSFTNRELHGIDAPLEAEIELKAGPFTAIFEPSRAYLRRVTINGTESVRVVYLHARKPDWGTIVPAVTMIRQDIGKDHFELTWKAVHREGEIDFEWMGTLKGDSTGIYYVADGEAKRDFKTNRTGMCVLITREFQGLNADVQHPDGSHSKVELPKLIAPVEPLRDMQSVTVGPVKLTFEGDVFEAEDQRNWTDASFKCYSLRGRRKPAYSLAKGEKIRHAVRIEATGYKPATDFGTYVGNVTYPLLGATLSNDHDDLSGLPLDFLRLELSGKTDRDRHILDHARSAGLPLLIVVPKGAQIPEFHPQETLIMVDAVERRPGFGSAFLGAGSFDSFNMGRHEIRGFDGVDVSVTPQVHTFDERSILENAATLNDVIGSLDAIAPNASISLNVQMKSGAHDHRLDSLFGAIWMLCCYKSCLRDVRLTLGTTGDLKNPFILSMIKELRGSFCFHGFRIGDVVNAGGKVGSLYANTRRVPVEVHFDTPFEGAETLTSAGWKPVAYNHRITLGPYEILRVKPVPGQSP